MCDTIKLPDFENRTVSRMRSADIIVFKGKTSAVTAYCQINGEKANIPDINIYYNSY
jgi:hypothetical protein